MVCSYLLWVYTFQCRLFVAEYDPNSFVEIITSANRTTANCRSQGPGVPPKALDADCRTGYLYWGIVIIDNQSQKSRAIGSHQKFLLERNFWS